MGIPLKMRAAIIEKQCAPLVVDEVGLPETLGPGQALVKVFYSGICGSQLGEISGVKGDDRFLPHLLGHEGSGEVLETGPGVQLFQRGDQVVMHWRKGIGLEGAPPVYTWRGKVLNAGFVTTFNQYAIVSENRLTRLPDGLPMEIGPLLGCAVTTGLGVINNNAKVRIGESVLVLGSGGVGLNIIQGAKMCSAYPIIAVDVYANRLKMAAKFGATHLVNSKEGLDFEGEIQSILGGVEADVTTQATPR